MASTTANLPTRSATDGDDVLPDEDSSEAAKLFHERLQAWKHACGYLEDYISANEKLYSSNAKEYEKAVKTVSNPLREAHHFQQSAGGISGLFENLRANTQGFSNSSNETAKSLKASVLPIFERLHSEIKSKTKELTKGAGKGAKAVDKTRSATQKHVELLGQHSATFDSGAANLKAHEDPYVLHRQVYHRLNKQVLEENNNRDDMIAVQDNFSRFEAHVVQTFQQGIGQFNQVVNAHIEQARSLHANILGNAQSIRPDFEWNGFIRNNAATLIDPSAPKRTVENIGFANQDHKSTKPLIAGSLERKGKVLKRYDTGFYAVTHSKYLHEFKSDDDFAKDPTPENSLYLPDCLVGAVDGVKFNVRGKDTSKGGIGSAFSMTQEYAFKAHTPEDAKKWHDVIASVAGASTNDKPESKPTSPVVSKGETPTTAIPSSEIPPPATTAAPEKVPETAGVPTIADPTATTVGEKTA